MDPERIHGAMLNLDPSKLLVIAVVAIILLGPDRLPTFARQVGAFWRSFTEYRHRLEAQVRDSMPDLPSSAEIARLARSPGALLDHLSSMSPEDEGASATPQAVPEAAGDGIASETAADIMTRAAAAYRPTEDVQVRHGTLVPGQSHSDADPGLN
jgi:Sec-independent protein translocase protein TatA